MRQGSFTLDNLMNYIYGEQISKIPAKMYNDDAQVKYLDFGSLYTYCCHGSKEHQIRRWLRERIAYVDSMLGYFTSQEDQVTIRMNKTGQVSFEVTPYIPLYFSVKWSNATGGTQTFKLKRGETKTFNYSSTTSTDQEVIIYHAKYIKRLDNLSNLNPSSCILSNAVKLTNVEIHSSELYNINVTNNKFLRSINLENCTALGTVTATGSSLNLSNCKYLRYCNVYNTHLTEVQLNTSGGSLTEIYYPKSIQSINLVKQRLLELIGLPYGKGGKEIPTSLYTISIQDCPSITKLNTSSDTTIASSFASMVYANNLTIRNSLDLASLKFDGFHRLQNVTIENMYNLEEVGFNNLLPVGETSTIKYIGMSNCPKLGTIELNCTSNDYEITFADNAILNFGGLFKLNSITSNCVLKGIKTIVVPINLESMFFTSEYGSGYSTIENIWVSSQCNVDTQATTPIVTHVDSTYSGIDFLGMNLKNIDLGALVNIPKAINFKLSPTTVNPHFNLNRDGETYKYLQPVGTLDLSNYTESLAKFFDGVDLDKLEIICNNNLPQTDLSYCFYNSTFSTNEAINKLLTKVSSITNLNYCFYRTTINSVDILGDINMGDSSSMNYTFAECPNIKELNSLVIPSNVTSVEGMFNKCPLTVINNMVVNVRGSISGLFKGCNKLTTINTLRIPNVTDVSNTFDGCTSLSSLSGFELPTSCTNVSNLFNGCYMLTELGMNFSSNITAGDNWYPPNLEALHDTTISNDCVKLTNCTTLKTLNGVNISGGDLSDLFNGCTNLVNINSCTFNATSSLARAFKGCSKITINPITTIVDTVTDISEMYSGCTGITDISGMTFGSGITDATNWIPPGLTTANNVTIKNSVTKFNGCTNLISCDNLTIAEGVTSLENLFYICSSLTSLLDFRIPDTVTDIHQMLYECNNLTDISGMTIGSGVTRVTHWCNTVMSPIYANNITIKNDVVNFNNKRRLKECKNLSRPNSTDWTSFFEGCTSLPEDIIFPSNTTNVTNCFKGCTSMTHIHSNWNNSYDSTITSTDCYSGCTGITHIDGENVIYNEYSEGLDEVPETWGGYGFSVNNTAIVVVEIPSDALTFQFNDTYGGLSNILKTSWGDGTSDSNQKIHTYSTSGTYAIKVKYADATINTNQTILHGNYTPASGNSSLRSAGTKVVQVPIGTQIGMSHFREWSKLQTVHLDRAILNSPSYIFHNTPALERVDLTNCSINGVGKDTWLNSPKITTINIAGSTITDGEFLFTDANALTTILGLDTADFSSNYKITGMFANCKELLTVPPLSTLLASDAKPKDLWKVYLMCSKVTTIDISGVDFSEATRIRQMFARGTALTNIIGFNEADLSKVTDLWNIFGDTPNLAIPIDLSNLNRSEPVYMAEAFYNCGVTELSGLSGIMLSAHNYLKTFQSMPNIKNLDVSGLDTSRVTGFGTAWASYIYGCPNVETVDLSNLNILGCGATGSFYDLCRSMGKLKSLVSKNANVSNLTGLATFLYECPELVDLDLESWDISNVTAQGSFAGKSFKLTNFKSFKNINCDMNFSWFPLLTVESLMSIINALKTTTTTKKLTLGSTNLAKLTSAQIKIAADKGWTVV